ncbi:unnamed protein product [Rotaria sp. Silwood1]|nr:unnamed protein product [Rotaria sp. Silwood1]CAF3419828.1 unnamed protein product [Rotaria sp. Silwood1]CAF3455282.1 unnamed protein product [Rotaria sp. Silwood1]CAF4641313.1 unnamed protein product [Rotaria sp. Silwood1]CAF4731388.1 unnamed protein product [Rotaria sp. Silwood1]
MAAAPSRQTQRIEKDLNALNTNPLPFIQNLNLAFNDGVNELTGTLIGPDETPYAGGHFRFIIKFPPEYPFKPPEFYFITAMCHPNVHSKTGNACHDHLTVTWAPSITLAKLLTEMHSLLEKPNYEIPLEEDPLNEKNADKARLWTDQFAQP